MKNSLAPGPHGLKNQVRIRRHGDREDAAEGAAARSRSMPAMADEASPGMSTIKKSGAAPSRACGPQSR